MKLNLNEFLILEKLTIQSRKLNIPREHIEDILRDMFSPSFYKTVIQKILEDVPLKINIVDSTKRKDDPEGYKTDAKTTISDRDISIDIEEKFYGSPKFNNLLTHEFIHVLQGVLTKQNTNFREFENIFKEIIRKGIKKNETIEDFLIGEKLSKNFPHQEILAYLFNEKMNWKVIKPEYLFLAGKLLTKGNIFNQGNKSIKWNLKEIRKALRVHYSDLKKGVIPGKTPEETKIIHQAEKATRIKRKGEKSRQYTKSVGN